jgi:hypothetical protein
MLSGLCNFYSQCAQRERPILMGVQCGKKKERGAGNADEVLPKQKGRL